MHSGIALSRRQFLGLLAVAAGTRSVQAAGFPSRPITIVITAPPGGGADLLARTLGQQLSAALGQAVLVDPRPGASGIVASEFVLKAPPDGHTLLLVANAHVVNPSLFKKLPYDTLADFRAVDMLGRAAWILACSSALPVKTLGDVSEFAREKPDALTFGTFGANRMATELLRIQTNWPVRQIYYKGSSQALSDMLGGHLGFMLTTLDSIQPLLQSGRVRPLAVAADQRIRALPDVPTFKASGFKDYEADVWYGLVVRAGTPDPIVAQLAAQVGTAMAKPEVVARLHELDTEVASRGAAYFDRQIHEDIARWRILAKAAGIQPE